MALPTYVEEIAPTLTIPVVYLPEATAVYSDSVGVIVAAAYTVNYFVFEPLTLTVPDVPFAIHPLNTVGVIEEEPATEAVIKPLAFIEILGVAPMVFAGVVAVPAGTDTVA